MLELLKGTAAAFFNAMPDAIVVTDDAGSIVFMNTRAEALFGYTQAECAGRDIDLLVPERYRPGHRSLRESYHADPRPRAMAAHKNLSGRHRDGHDIPVDISLSPFDAGGRPLVIAAVRDVTERRRTEEALLRSEERYRFFAGNAQDIIYRVRTVPPARFDYVSPAVTRLTGFTPEEFYADPALGMRLVHPEDRPRLEAHPASPDAVNAPVTHRVIAKDGTVRWFDHRNVPVYDDDGTLVAIEGIARDVTQARTAEEALRESEARLRAAVENVPFAFWAFDAGGVLVMQNGVSKARLGDLVGLRLDEMGLPGDLTAAARETLRRALGGEVVQEEYQAAAANPEGRAWYVIAAPIVNGDRVTGAIGVTLDETSRRETERLEKELRHAQELDRLKDALLSTVSHELRTPLSVIRGYATMATDYADRISKREFAQYFRDIDTYAQRLDRLIGDLLTMPRLGADVLRLDLQPVELDVVARDTIRARGIAGGTRKYALTIGPGLSPVSADAHRIEQVIHNLLDNADKYSAPAEAIEVSVEGGAGDTVAVSVRDRGEGVPKGELDAIFDRFYRTAHHPSVGGAGLGLAVCRSIVEAHRGRIWASGRPDGGLAVTFSLPRIAQPGANDD